MVLEKLKIFWEKPRGEKDGATIKAELDKIIDSIPKPQELNSENIVGSTYLNENNLNTTKPYFVIDLQSCSAINYEILINEIAAFQLCGCNAKLYSDFSRQNHSSSIYDPNKSLIPIFKKDLFPNAKPIIIFGNQLLIELKGTSSIDRRISYLDSSIWIRYVSSEDEFEIVKADIEIYNKQGLYKTINAIECLEFHARLVKNSFLRPFEGQNSHSSFVSPFLFHSETAMRQKSDDLLKKNLQKYKALKWRILLVDDHSTENKAKEDSKDTAKVSIKSKCEIIRNVLSKDFNFSFISTKECEQECKTTCPVSNNTSNKIELIFDCSSDINNTIIKIKKRRYDLILLDYLLGWENNEKREYSYQLLSIIKNNNSTEGKGPYNQFWVFFISAFSNAVTARLHEQGMHYNTKDWHIARGACPTTTPEMFRYNLLSFMDRQIEIITELSLSNHAQKKMEEKLEKQVVSLLDLLLFIFENNDLTREYSGIFFNALLNLRANYDILKNDTCYHFEGENGSLLVNSLFPDIRHYDNAFWEHLQHLIYLTAFGTIRQWQDMWEEFRYVKSNLKKAEENLIEEKKVSFLIEQYIINLKNKISQ
jgi:hypothetical protein